MSVIDQHPEIWEGIRRGHAEGRLAHAYIVVGSPRGDALEFAEVFLKLLFCESAEKPCNACPGCRKVEGHRHMDVLWIEPQSKSRQILAEDIRTLIHRMTQTSFDGGWKAGVVVGADRMNPNSENALLKTLEEPPPGSLLLLLTDSPQGLLPTINSRCQKIVLSDGLAQDAGAPWREELLAILRELPPRTGLDASLLAGRLKGLFDGLRAEISDAVSAELGSEAESMDAARLKTTVEARVNARLKEVQAEVFRVLLDWHRDLLLLVSGAADESFLVFREEREALERQAAQHTRSSAMQAIQAVDEMARRTDRNMPPQQVFDNAFRKLIRK